ncbi:MAG: methyltransferase domain-containing protein [Bacteroidales bacterium]|nr:methyltransferase domain-containing protein [Bacteroidales bacterium]
MNALAKKFIPAKLGYVLRNLKLTIRGIYYSGKKHYCPLCGHSYRRFFSGGFDLPVITEMQIIGAGRRNDNICPGCASTDRDRLIHALLISKEFDFLPSDALLHIAPEPALYSWLQKNKSELLNKYIQGVKYHEGFYYNSDVRLFDLLAIPFDNESFDLVICNHVLEHIEADQKAMREIYRILKPGGKGILQVPWSPILEKTYEDLSITSVEDREKYFGQFDHVRLYGRDYPERLKSNGFEVQIVEPNMLGFDEKYLLSISINPKEVIFVVTKQV